MTNHADVTNHNLHRSTIARGSVAGGDHRNGRPGANPCHRKQGMSKRLAALGAFSDSETVKYCRKRCTAAQDGKYFDINGKEQIADLELHFVEQALGRRGSLLDVGAVAGTFVNARRGVVAGWNSTAQRAFRAPGEAAESTGSVTRRSGGAPRSVLTGSQAPSDLFSDEKYRRALADRNVEIENRQIEVERSVGGEHILAQGLELMDAPIDETECGRICLHHSLRFLRRAGGVQDIRSVRRRVLRSCQSPLENEEPRSPASKTLELPADLHLRLGFRTEAGGSVSATTAFTEQSVRICRLRRAGAVESTGRRAAPGFTARKMEARVADRFGGRPGILKFSLPSK